MPTQNPPSCPLCGRNMIIRTATRGPNAGHQFWGCLGFPNCRGIVDIKSTIEHNPQRTVDFQARNINSETFPQRNFTAQRQTLNIPRITPRKRVVETFLPDCPPNKKEHQTRFFQSVNSLPEIVSSLNHPKSGVTPQQINAFSQWRLDFPCNHDYENSDYSSLICVIEKILLRGSISYCSPHVEETIKNMVSFREYDVDRWMELLHKVDRHPRSNFEIQQFDSNEERFFYLNILPSLIDVKNVHPWIASQTSISSLTSDVIDPNSKQRVDFLCCSPRIGKFVIEVDGAQHEDQKDLDQIRDQALIESGFKVIRIPASQLSTSGVKENKDLQELTERFEGINPLNLSEDQDLEAMLLMKLASQFQITLFEALKNGFLKISDQGKWVVQIIAPDWICNEEHFQQVIQSATVDFSNLMNNIFMIHNNRNLDIVVDLDFSEKSKVRSDITVLFGWERSALNFRAPCFIISDVYLPFKISNPLLAGDTLVIEYPDKESAEYVLNFIFRKVSFLEGQWEAITRTLQKKDSILLLPTGGGKSIAFQLASFFLPGLCLVIDPLVALIDDQIDNLLGYGIDRAVGITSQLSNEEKSLALELFCKGQYLFCYVAPERFQMKEFRAALRGVTVHSPICLISIDEAHCVSEWGHDFRVSYLNIARNARNYCQKNGLVPPILGLTGTASRSVLRDVRRELDITEFDSVITPSSFDRSELKFTILQCHSDEKDDRLSGLLSSFPQRFSTTPNSFYRKNGPSSNTGLIFYPHVNGKFGIESGFEVIRNQINSDIGLYAGKPPKGFPDSSWDEAKAYYAQQFKNNEIVALACTNAFGMGIDKPNIRYTVHMNLPGSIEAFYQEAGRAGRDRRHAECCLIVSNDFPQRTNILLNPRTPLEDITRIVEGTTYKENDDILRAMFFHVNAFHGAQEEIRQVMNLINAIGDLEVQKNFCIPFSDKDKVTKEKAVHRLVIIGVIRDYTIDYAHNEIEISVSGCDAEENLQSYLHYLSNYDRKTANQAERLAREKLSISHSQFVEYLAERLIKDFIYNIIELSRRRSLSEMLQACVTNPTDEGIRARILNYLELGHYSEFLENARENSDDPESLFDQLFDEMDSPMEAAELRGQCSRMLEAYPNNPTLLLIRAFAEIFCSDRKETIVFENFKAFIAFSISDTGWGIPRKEAVEFAVSFIDRLGETNLPLAQLMTVSVLDEFSNDIEVARLMVSKLKRSISVYPVNIILASLDQQVSHILEEVS